MGSLDEPDGFFVPTPHSNADSILLSLENEYYQRTLIWFMGWESYAPEFMHKLHTARAHAIEGQ